MGLLNPKSFSKGTKVPAGYYRVASSSGIINKSKKGGKLMPVAVVSLECIDPDSGEAIENEFGESEYVLSMPVAFDTERVGIGDSEGPADEQAEGVTGTHTWPLQEGAPLSGIAPFAKFITTLCELSEEWAEKVSGDDDDPSGDLTVLEGLCFKLEYQTRAGADKENQFPDPVVAQVLDESEFGGKRSKGKAKPAAGKAAAKAKPAKEEEESEDADNDENEGTEEGDDKQVAADATTDIVADLVGKGVTSVQEVMNRGKTKVITALAAQSVGVRAEAKRLLADKKWVEAALAKALKAKKK